MRMRHLATTSDHFLQEVESGFGVHASNVGLLWNTEGLPGMDCIGCGTHFEDVVLDVLCGFVVFHAWPNLFPIRPPPVANVSPSAQLA